MKIKINKLVVVDCSQATIPDVLKGGEVEIKTMCLFVEIQRVIFLSTFFSFSGKCRMVSCMKLQLVQLVIDFMQ